MPDNLPILYFAEQMLRGLRNELNIQEEMELLEWLDKHPEQKDFFIRLANEQNMEAELAFLADTGREKAWKDLQQKLALSRNKENHVFRLWKRIAAAAVILIVAGVVLYLYKDNQSRKKIVIQDLAVNDIKAGGNKAYLTLADGKRIALTNAENGKVAEQAGLSIIKTADGQLIYEVKGNQGAAEKNNGIVSYNTISVPAGGKYRVSLPDGTRVWLNASSSLKYATSVANLKERSVELNGEAYFEVSKLDDGGLRKPFIVKSKNQEVVVLGTHFNVSSYVQEDVTVTTLLEGSVKVKPDGLSEKTIVPGEQALAGKDIKVIKVDTAIAVAWKNGLFKFENANINTVMTQFSRWYNFDVEYEGKVPGNKFNGEIYRDLNASQALKILNYAKIKFRAEVSSNDPGRKKIVITSN